MYKISFTLKQHTPIIHFQHDQEGATLRSSEFKPKLDRFLITKMGWSITNYDKPKPVTLPKKEFNHLFNDINNLSLDYKIKIFNSNLIWEGIVTIIPPNKDTAIKRDDFKIEFSSNNSLLLKTIENYIDEFLLLNNFGKRQSKGFGSFTLETTKIEKLKDTNKSIFIRKTQDELTKDELLFYSIISKAWRELKSGSNRPYKKSRVFKYLFLNEMRWEKRWFKVALYDKINDPDTNDPELKHQLLYSNNEPLDVSDEENGELAGGYYDYTDNDDPDFSEYFYFFGRALLGLAEHYEFRTNRNDRIYQLKVKSTDIERFRCPVTFKVINNKILAIAETIPKSIIDTDFQFDLIVKDPNTKKIIREIENFTELPTPVTFSLVEFLEDNFSFVGFKKLEL